MKLSDQAKPSERVRLLEDSFAAFAEMYREELQAIIGKYNGSDSTWIRLQELSYYSEFSPHLKNQFYPIEIGDYSNSRPPEIWKSVGLILPLRKQVFHSLDIGISEEAKVLTALSMGLSQIGYEIEKSIMPYRNIMASVIEGELPANQQPF